MRARSRSTPSKFHGLSWLLIAAMAQLALAADQPAEPGGPVAATVNGEPISVEEVREAVDRALGDRALGGRQLSPEELAKSQTVALGQLIDKRLVKGVLTKAGMWAGDAEVDAALTQIRLQHSRGDAAEQKVAWGKYLRERGVTEAEFRRQLAWQLSWEKFMRARLTDAMLEDYFNAHRRDFDGTQLRVSHLLLGPLPSDRQATADLLETASQLREQITSGKIEFEAAVKKHSTGPSRDQGGDIGFIPRHGLMVEAFAKAAFRLKPGEISPPVATPFGVHLIKVVEVKPGVKKWSDVRDQLKPVAAQSLFQEVAKEERKKAKIAFSGAMVPPNVQDAPHGLGR